MSDLLARLTSRKFLLAAAACVYVVVQIAGGSVTVNDGLDSIVKIVIGYMASEGLADAAGRFKPSSETDPAPKPAAPAVPATN
jgi:hypothetical protein